MWLPLVSLCLLITSLTQQSTAAVVPIVRHPLAETASGYDYMDDSARPEVPSRTIQDSIGDLLEEIESRKIAQKASIQEKRAQRQHNSIDPSDKAELQSILAQLREATKRLEALIQRNEQLSLPTAESEETPAAVIPRLAGYAGGIDAFAYSKDCRNPFWHLDRTNKCDS